MQLGLSTGQAQGTAATTAPGNGKLCRSLSRNLLPFSVQGPRVLLPGQPLCGLGAFPDHSSLA